MIIIKNNKRNKRVVWISNDNKNNHAKNFNKEIGVYVEKGEQNHYDK